MGILSRLKTLVAAKANDTMDDLEDKNLSSLMEQTIREKKIALQEAQDELDEVGGQVSGYEREVVKLKEDLKRWEGNAETALTDDPEDKEGLAAAACTRAEEVESNLRVKQQALDSVRSSYDAIDEQISSTAKDLREAEGRLKVTQAQIKAADASKKARAKATKVVGTDSSLSRISEIEARAQQKIDTEASAAARVRRESGADLEKRFEDMEEKKSSEDRLAKLRAKMEKKRAKVSA